MADGIVIVADVIATNYCELATTPAIFQKKLAIGKKYMPTISKNHNIMKNNILQTPSRPGVLQGKTFFHTSDEARSVGLAKACVLLKYLFCYREISFKITKILFNFNRGR